MTSRNIRLLLDKYSPAELITEIEPFINEARRERIQQVINSRIKQITLAFETPSDINNALAAVRTAEALGISDIHLITPEGSANTIHTITRGAHYWVELHTHPNLTAFANMMQTQGFVIAGAVMSVPTTVSELKLDKPLCLLFGNEQRGLTPAAQALCDTLFCIPMYGMSESLNLAVTAAISAFVTSEALRKKLGSHSDLSTEQQQTLTAKYYLKSISSKLIQVLLQR